MESMTLEKATARLFEDNFDCAQTVFAHFAEGGGRERLAPLHHALGQVVASFAQDD